MASLDYAQRVTLDAMYRILEILEPSGGWDSPRRIVVEGLEGEYKNLAPAFYNPVSEDECELVKKLLHMFESLADSFNALALQDDELKTAIEFTGLDLNVKEEARLARYARFLFETDRWGSQRPQAPDLNSHTPMLDDYKRMLVAFSTVIDHEFARDFREKPLSEEELQIVAGLRT